MSLKIVFYNAANTNKDYKKRIHDGQNQKNPTDQWMDKKHN
jgi:hypothetical protein